MGMLIQRHRLKTVGKENITTTGVITPTEKTVTASRKNAKESPKKARKVGNK